MKYLKIQNKGVLDIRLVALMGGTTKSKDKFKIGQFGTGLKYMLAYCFRNNIDFKIFCGSDEQYLSTESEEIAGEIFEIICINGHRTSITTKMGMDWQSWMIVREIWCNALDEGEATWEITDVIERKSDHTTFYLQVTSEIREVIDNWDKYFIHKIQPLYEDANVAIYPGGNELRIYKHGVLIEERKQDDKKALFAYDKKDAIINELREFRGSVDSVMAHCLSAGNEKVAKYFLENVTADTFEGGADLDWYTTWSDAWKETIGDAKLISKEAVDNLTARGIPIEDGKYIIVPKSVYGVLTRYFKGIGALYVSSRSNEFLVSYDESTEKRVMQVVEIMKNCNIPLHPELTFNYGFFEDKAIEAQINRNEKVISISNTLANASTLDLLSVLIEENVHFITGFSDCTREFQSYFIKQYAQTILKLHGIEV